MVDSKANSEKLDEFFQCVICLEKLNNPHLCPHCSRPCCYKCITKWLREQRQECPYCRTSLDIKRLVKCYWLLDLAARIENLGFNILPAEIREEEVVCSQQKKTDQQTTPSDIAALPSSSNPTVTPNTETPIRTIFRWQSSHRNFEMPEDALLAGEDSDGSPIYVGRAWHENDRLAAKIIPNKRAVFISYGCEEILVSSFDVLCGKGFKWVESSEGNVPPNAISTGRTSYGERLYIGRGRWEGSLTPGKIHPSHGCLYIPYGGQEINLQHYETLVRQ